MKKPSVTLPSGSYVKAKLLTGVEAPEGKTYPALIQLDYAYIIPNQKRLDLAGCFMIAKAQGDLSTERVQMQATKLSCVSKRGGMFEREVNGFIADDADNSFAVMGSVNTKQDRVAATAFLASIVSGVGNPPVGLILCAEKHEMVAKYALEGLPNKVVAAQYRTALPEVATLVAEMKKTQRFIEAKHPLKKVDRKKNDK